MDYRDFHLSLGSEILYNSVFMSQYLSVCMVVCLGVLVEGTKSHKIDINETKMDLKCMLFYFYHFFKDHSWGCQGSKQVFLYESYGSY